MIAAVTLGSFAQAAEKAKKVTPPPTQKSAYFMVSFAGSEKTTPMYVVRIDKPELIKQARAELKKPVNRRQHVGGKIAASGAGFNNVWNFHIIPTTLYLFEATPEYCDSSAEGVRDNLAEWLQIGMWCPWSSYISSEMAALH